MCFFLYFFCFVGVRYCCTGVSTTHVVEDSLDYGTSHFTVYVVFSLGPETISETYNNGVVVVYVDIVANGQTWGVGEEI